MASKGVGMPTQSTKKTNRKTATKTISKKQSSNKKTKKKRYSNKPLLIIAGAFVLVGIVTAMFVNASTDNKTPTVAQKQSIVQNSQSCKEAVKVYPNNCLDVQTYESCKNASGSTITSGEDSRQCTTTEGRQFTINVSSAHTYSDKKLFSITIPAGWTNQTVTGDDINLISSDGTAGCTISTSRTYRDLSISDEGTPQGNPYDEGSRVMTPSEVEALKSELSKNLYVPTDLKPGYKVTPTTINGVAGVKISGKTDDSGGQFSQVVTRYSFVLSDTVFAYQFTLSSVLDVNVTEDKNCHTAFNEVIESLKFIN